MESTFSYKLESFEGPLDLLLQLIARNKLNINDIPLTELIDQYLEQIQLFKEEEMDIASEFLEMAARLIYIKTVSLLPKHDEIIQLKAELTGELLEYQLCQEMAGKLSLMTAGFDTFIRKPTEYEFDKTYQLKHERDILYNYYFAAVGRGQRKLPPDTTAFTKIVAQKIVSVSTRIVYVMRNLWRGGTKRLSSLYKTARTRSELVATFLAVRELCKANRVEVEGNSDEAEIKLIKGHKRNEKG